MLSDVAVGRGFAHYGAMTPRPAIARATTLIVSLFMLGALAACETAAPKTPAPQLSYTDLPSIRLDVTKIEIVDEYLPPLKAPNVEHEFPISPSEAVERWARDRLVAGGRDRVARFIIRYAAVTEAALKKKTGLTGLLTTDQSERYDGRVAVTLEIRSDRGFREAFADATSEHSRTVPGDASVNQREKIFFEITERLVRELNAEIERQIAAHLSPFRIL